MSKAHFHLVTGQDPNETFCDRGRAGDNVYDVNSCDCVDCLRAALDHGARAATRLEVVLKGRCGARWRAGIIIAPGDDRVNGGRCTLERGHEGEHKTEVRR